jgi:hypothetical protein
MTKFAAEHENNGTIASPLLGESGEPVRPSAANGPERNEGAQGEHRELGEGGVTPAILESAARLVVLFFCLFLVRLCPSSPAGVVGG